MTPKERLLAKLKTLCIGEPVLLQTVERKIGFGCWRCARRGEFVLFLVFPGSMVNCAWVPQYDEETGLTTNELEIQCPYCMGMESWKRMNIDPASQRYFKDLYARSERGLAPIMIENEPVQRPVA